MRIIFCMTFQLFSFLFMVLIILLFYKDATRCTKLITTFINTDLSCKYILMYFQNTAGCSWFWDFWIVQKKLCDKSGCISPWVLSPQQCLKCWRANIWIECEMKLSPDGGESKWLIFPWLKLTGISIRIQKCWCFSNDMCNLWLNRFGSWDKVVKFDANNLYLQNNKRQT